MRQAIPRIMFAAPSSGSGKTMVTCGFLALCRKRGLDCRAMKCGPDYIDPLFHHYVLGISGANLDSFFLCEEAVRALFLKETAGCDMAVIEGVMGYYDGLAGISTQASSYDIARITDTPVILVVDGKRGSLSLAALIKGFQEFRGDSRICGVILNRTGEAMAERLRPQIEALGIYLAGWIPECEEARLESRHLGLTLPGEQHKLGQKAAALAGRMEASLDLDWLLATAGLAAALDDGTEGKTGAEGNDDVHLKMKADKKNTDRGRLRIAVARDEAFSFYYQENLRFLREMGAELLNFSPLHDEVLPDDLDAVLLGGGYPELYAAELSDNRSMRESLNGAAAAGVKIMAECGGFLYLHQTLEGADGNQYPMSGVIPGHGFRTGRLSRFGYLTLQGADGKIKGHEFHYWDSDNCGDSCVAVKPLIDRSWKCMHLTKTLLAGFPHLYYQSNPELIYRFLISEEC